MRITRSKKQWKPLLEAQQTSGLTIIDYCREHQLSTSNFYVFKKIAFISSRFVHAKVIRKV
jgi:putative transposase